MFKVTLFEHGNVGYCAGVEEIWFRSVDDLARLRRDPALYGVLRAGYDTFVDEADTCSTVTTEWVIYDFITSGRISPKGLCSHPGCARVRSRQARLQGMERARLGRGPVQIGRTRQNADEGIRRDR